MTNANREVEQKILEALKRGFSKREKICFETSFGENKVSSRLQYLRKKGEVILLFGNWRKLKQKEEAKELIEAGEKR